MKSVVLRPRSGEQSLEPTVTESEVPAPGAGELVVRMAACGLCGTDLEKMRGEYTASMPVIGHEAVGTVAAVGKGAGGFRVGDRVFPHHHVPDYSCYLCRAGNETMCDHYRSSNLDPGGFSEYFRVPRWNMEKGAVLKLPKGMPFETASLIEPLGCCQRSIRKCGIRRGDAVLVVGAGPVGVMHALLLNAAGARVFISDVSEGRLKLAGELKAGDVLDARSDVPEEVRSGTGGRGADAAIVASGSRAAIIQGLRSLRKGGKVCLFGVPAKGSVLDYDISELYNAERGIVTSYGAVEEDTRAALEVLSVRGAEFGRLVTHRFPLERFGQAVEAASGGAAMKVVLTP
ncbi:MAG: alcohol dehydrogenase catalytic domain-containing protein [Nitrososphaerota archaeon]|nr:alcohol dehydrogenase catalytic domain-containing protein [Nitrososphaerota archaeon]MDG7023223.1 alcohol dehydrogenase catalytic domain-containing protein [Nitrososphaerota archaeon]